MSRGWLAIVLGGLSAGCAHWTVQQGGIDSVLGAAPRKVLITRTDSSQTILASPFLEPGRIVGYRVSWRGRVYPDHMVTVRLEEVASVATWYEGETRLVPLGIIALPVAMFIAGLASAGAFK